MRRFIAILGLIAVPASVFLIRSSQAQDRTLVVHEWGTFTSLQNDSGASVGGIGQDVEPLPPFVVDLYGGGPKGIVLSPAMAKAVTMRLETPVVYFHPPKNGPVQKLTFTAQFRGGLLTQFYPSAATSGVAGPLENSAGTLTWKDVKIGTGASGPPTTSPVWLAPREVEAASVTGASGDSEKYLFYRGIGHLDGPIAVVQRGGQLEFTRNPTDSTVAAASMRFDTFWYLDIRDDGTSAFRQIDVTNPQNANKVLATAPMAFAESDYSAQAISELKDQMLGALTKAGLYQDEAAAMLKTWEQAYFKSPGTRVFYVVPRAWTDLHLPITVSVAATIERVMVGRIDLISPRQRDIAGKVLSMSDQNSEQGKALQSQLGRFAAPILASERARRESAAAILPPAP